MGKKAKVYKPGDFVFAKVKGYPAWPAKVVSFNGKKYSIYFYGTGESGNLLPNDLFDYFEHKQKFSEKVLKRRDYNEGLLQIESETQELGITSNDNKLEMTLDTTNENDNSAIEPSIETDLDQTAADVPIAEASVSTPDVAKIPKKRGAETPNSASQPPAKSRKISDVDVKESDKDVNNTSQNIQEETSLNEKVIDDVEKEAEIPEASNVAETSVTEEIVKTPATGRGRKPNKISQSATTKTPRKAVKQEVMSPVYEPHIPVLESVSRSGRKIKPKRYLDEETGDAQTPQIPAKKIKTQPITPSTPQLMSPEEEDNIVTSLVSESSAVPVNASQTTPATTEGTARRGRKKIVKQNSKTFNLISQSELEKYLDPSFVEDEVNDLPKDNVLPAVLPKGEVVGIKCPKEWPEFNSLKTKQEWITTMIQNMTRIKQELENGQIMPAAISNQLETELNLSSSEIDLLRREKENETRKKTLHLLRLEHRFLGFDRDIRLALNSESANTEKCIQLLDELAEFHISKLMLLKNPKTMFLIKSLRRYIGNVEHWKLSDEETEEFKKKAVIINKKAENCFEKMKKLFDVKDDESFASQFSEQLVTLKVLSESMKANEFTELVDEPPELLQNSFNMPSEEIKHKIKELKEKQFSNKIKSDSKTVS